MLYMVYLTFIQMGWYLNFGASFMKNVSIIWTENKKIMKGMSFCGN